MKTPSNRAKTLAGSVQSHSNATVSQPSLPPWLLIAGIVLFLLVVGFILVVGSSKDLGFSKSIIVIPLHGSISPTPDALSPDSLSTQEIVDALKEANENPSIGAILLDIQSPGGSIVATKQIVSQIRHTQKPVVAWIGDLGASGAYYSAAAAQFVMADADSITGSIGVIGMFTNVEGLLEKIGVKVKIVKEGKFKSIGSPFKEMTTEEEKLLQTLLHDAFLNFKNDIREFRGEKLDAKKFEEVTDGRVLSGSQALQAGLIDQLGTREEAIQKAAELASIPGKPKVETVSKPLPSLLDFFFNAGTSFGRGFKNSFSFSAESFIQARS